MFGAVRRSAQESLKRAAELLDARHASKASQSGRVQGSWKRNSASSCPRLTRLLAADGDRGELDSWACATPHNAASQRGCHKSRAHPGIRYRSPSPSLWASQSFGDPNNCGACPGSAVVWIALWAPNEHQPKRSTQARQLRIGQQRGCESTVWQPPPPYLHGSHASSHCPHCRPSHYGHRSGGCTGGR